MLQEKEFERLGGTKTIKADVRVICATHQDLSKMIKEKKFRQDLYYRINVFPVQLPPLRKRREDIPLLISHFMHKYNKENKKNIDGVSRATLDVLVAHDWPGNVRELENVVEHAVVLCQGDLISPQNLPANLSQRAAPAMAPLKGTTLPEIVESIEKQKIAFALKKFGTQRKAAKVLGITERMLGYKISKYGL